MILCQHSKKLVFVKILTLVSANPVAWFTFVLKGRLCLDLNFIMLVLCTP
jgi:hypothetical protein